MSCVRRIKSEEHVEISIANMSDERTKETGGIEVFLRIHYALNQSLENSEADSSATPEELTEIGTQTSVGMPLKPGLDATAAQYAVWRAFHRVFRSSCLVA